MNLRGPIDGVLELLIARSLEGTLNQEEMDRLGERLFADRRARRYYIELMAVHANLCETRGVSAVEDSGELNREVFRRVVEKDLDDSAMRRVMRQADSAGVMGRGGAELRLQRRDITRGQLMVAAMRTAVIVAACLGILWLDGIANRPADFTRRPVARVLDQVGAGWGGREQEWVVGSGLATGDYALTRGLVKLCLSEGAEVLVEGPARFTLDGGDRLTLASGRLYARVSQLALGFTIRTPDTKIVDLGTEFGVQVGDGYDTELHVIKGRAQLIAGQTGRDKVSVVVEQGRARRVESGKVSRIVVQNELFVRRIDGASGLVWRGQQGLRLADMLGRGDGLALGTEAAARWARSGLLVGCHIDPATGEVGQDLRSARTVWWNEQWDPGQISNRYQPVPDLSVVDGVFVPGGPVPGGLVTSSAGHRYTACPVVSGRFHFGITNFVGAERAQELALDTTARDYLLMTANQGITFDLERVRQGHPALVLTGFATQVGFHGVLAKADGSEPGSRIAVLVDGQERYCHQGAVGERVPVRIPLTAANRFLTLVVTEGPGELGQALRGRGNDWCIFYEPKLDLYGG